METLQATDYNSILYPTVVHPQTHPNRLATRAILHGMNPASIEKCRMLELGCNDGLNLISLATALPNSSFVGYDLASVPVEKGKKLIDELGLTNVQIEARDIMELPDDIGRFDYIVAHGLYSWVPEPVRKKILDICRSHLTEQGVAYISYNAYPGNHMRDLVRGIIRFHTQKIETVDEKIAQSRAIIKFLSESRYDETDSYQALLKDELKRITEYIDYGFYHDDLSEMNQPFYFHEFVRDAQEHGLQFLAETRKYILTSEKYKPEAIDLLKQLKNGDRIAQEQYFDFMTGMSFRQTLICHQEVKIVHHPQPPLMQKIFLSGPISADSNKLNLNDVSVVGFSGLDGASIETADPLAKNACNIIGAVWPRQIAFMDLLKQAQSQAGSEADKEALFIELAEHLASFLLETYNIGFVEFHSYATTFPTTPGEFPKVSPLALNQIRKGPDVVNLKHENMRIEGDLARELIELLDGTRNKEMLADALIEQLGSDNIAALLNFKEDKTPTSLKEKLLEELEEKLNSLARAGLLVS
jgi:methyltransferase-like protein